MCLRDFRSTRWFVGHIPAGAEDYRVEQRAVLPVTVELAGLYPHCHYLGKEFIAWARLPTGERWTLLHIPDWNFDWQDGYSPHEPISVERGDQLNIRCVYDNPSDQTINWGDETGDEMCLVYLLHDI